MTFSTPLPARVGLVFVLILFGAMFGAALMATVFLVGTQKFDMAAILALLAVFMAAMFFYLLRDVRGKLGWKITVGRDGVDLSLPGGRSLIHRLTAVKRHLSYSEIEAVEARFEAYPGLGMANMQRCFALKLKTGEVIILGEDRALGTTLASSLVFDAAQQISETGGIPGRDLGMVEGKLGLAGVAFASAPPWTTQPLEEARAEQLWRRARMTGTIAAGGIFPAILGR